MDKDSFSLIAYHQKKLHLQEQEKLQEEITMLKKLISDHTDLEICSKCSTYNSDFNVCDMCQVVICTDCLPEPLTCAYCRVYHCDKHMEICYLCDDGICSYCIDDDIHSCNDMSNSMSDSMSDSGSD
jgi:hypothetical protein